MSLHFVWVYKRKGFGYLVRYNRFLKSWVLRFSVENLPCENKSEKRRRAKFLRLDTKILTVWSCFFRCIDNRPTSCRHVCHWKQAGDKGRSSESNNSRAETLPRLLRPRITEDWFYLATSWQVSGIGMVDVTIRANQRKPKISNRQNRQVKKLPLTVP